MEFIDEFLIKEVLILIPFLVVLGHFIKITDFIKDKWIPLTLMVVSIFMAISIMGLGVHAVIQGVLVAGASVLANELVKQFNQEE